MATVQDEIRRLATLLQQGQLTRETFQAQVEQLKAQARAAAQQAGKAGKTARGAAGGTAWRLPAAGMAPHTGGAPIVESGPDLRPRGRMISVGLVIVCLLLMGWSLIAAARGDSSMWRVPTVRMPELPRPRVQVPPPPEPTLRESDRPLPEVGEEPPKPGDEVGKGERKA